LRRLTRSRSKTTIRATRMATTDTEKGKCRFSHVSIHTDNVCEIFTDDKVRFITGGSILTEKWSTSVPAIDSSISKKLVNSSLNDGYDVSILKDMIETDTLRVESDA